MRILLIVVAASMSTPVFAQSSGGDAATGGAALAGLSGMFGLFGFVIALVYSILLFFLPFMVWGCLTKLTSIRDDIRGLRKEITALATRMTVSPPLPSTEQHQVNDITSLRRLVKENENYT
jgi:hypothetical protein